VLPPPAPLITLLGERGDIMEVDPRYAMAQVYKALRGKAELTDQFTTEVNNCNGPADAFKICMKYLSLANAS